MTREKFILSKSEIDFFFKPKGSFKSLVCGNLENGIFKSIWQLEFNESGNIKSEIGYQNGWTAYPPGTIPPPPIQYLRKYTYKNGLLGLVKEEDNKSKEYLKSYKFNYEGEILREIIESKANSKEHSRRSTIYEYCKNGFLSTEKIYISVIGDAQIFINSEIMRNDSNQIIKIMSSNSAERKGKLISKQEISTKYIEYDGDQIRKIHRSPNHDKSYTTTAQLLEPDSEMIKTIIYPKEFADKQKVEYDFDEYRHNIIKKKVSYKDKIVTEIYSYG